MRILKTCTHTHTHMVETLPVVSPSNVRAIEHSAISFNTLSSFAVCGGTLLRFAQRLFAGFGAKTE